jgi:hypothetical protein
MNHHRIATFARNLLGRALFLTLLSLALLWFLRGTTAGVQAQGPEGATSDAVAGPSGSQPPYTQADFENIVEGSGTPEQRPGQGFGDRQNSYAWAMEWWNGYLYVGTSRAFRCVEIAAINTYFPGITPYPPNDPDIECTPEWEDLPLQAEIWRYSPSMNTWEMVYRSPNDIPIPGQPGKFVARDIAFRDMIVFTDPDGTEALYVSGVSARDLYRNIPPPRLLRTTDGENFAAVPQDPGTNWGDITNESLRTLAEYNDQLYVVSGSLYGAGALYAAANPAGGNDNFRQVNDPDPPGTTPPLRIFEMLAFDGELYIGTRDATNGYSVLKTDGEGSPYHTFTEVVPPGAYRTGENKAEGVISMYAFKGHLYVGTDKVKGNQAVPENNIGAELIRIHADDSWDLVMGASRNTPMGSKTPLSGIGDGFGWPYNIHVWRMMEHRGNLYIGTADAATAYRQTAAGPSLEPKMGFDMWVTPDGTNFTKISDNGFGDKFDFGIRNWASTPYGLFFGTANYYYGTQVYLARDDFNVFLPAITRPE